MVREIITEWTGPGRSPKLNIMYFGEGASVATQRTALETFFDALLPRIASSYSYRIRTEGRELSDTTGTLTALWNEPTAKDGIGGLANEPLPDANAALIRWRTAEIISGRLLQGRTYVPGVTTTNVTGGNLNAATVAAFSAAAAALVASAAAFRVWHRPQNGVGGGVAAATSGTCWNEVAVQRRRRG